MLILIAMIAFAAGTVRSFNATSSWVLHTQDVRLQLGETLSQLKDALQDTRVHPIPGAEERLASQPQKRAEIAGLLADLREKTKDNAKQQEALRQLEGHVARAYHEIDAFTELRRAGNLVAVSERALAGGSTRLGDDIGATIIGWRPKKRDCWRSAWPRRDAMPALPSPSWSVALGSMLC